MNFFCQVESFGHLQAVRSVKEGKGEYKEGWTGSRKGGKIKGRKVRKSKKEKKARSTEGGCFHIKTAFVCPIIVYVVCCDGPARMSTVRRTE